MRTVYVEDGVGMAHSAGAAVWSFDSDLWGICTQGKSPEEALAAWRDSFGAYRIAEGIHGDEQAFRRDLEPASEVERRTTEQILKFQRLRALDLLGSLSAAALDCDDPGRAMPSWAWWRTARQTLWHLCDTESRYYLPQLGLPSRERQADLREELLVSHEHVGRHLESLPPSRIVRVDGEVWTSVKLLRRLAWHERGELDAITQLVAG